MHEDLEKCLVIERIDVTMGVRDDVVCPFATHERPELAEILAFREEDGRVAGGLHDFDNAVRDEKLRQGARGVVRRKEMEVPVKSGPQYAASYSQW